MKDEIGRASVFLFTPCWDEPFGLVAIEAMACGVPVAGLARGAAAEVVGEAGHLAPPDDGPALARAIGATFGRAPEYVVSPGTYDQKHIDRIGKLKNCIAYGPGVLDLAHQPDEWIGVGDMMDSARVMALVLSDLLGTDSHSPAPVA